MLDPNCKVTEYDDYKYEFIGKDSPELRAQAEAAKNEAIHHAEELKQKYGTATGTTKIQAIPTEDVDTATLRPYEVIKRLRSGQILHCPECKTGIIQPIGDPDKTHEYHCSAKDCKFRILID